ncbi:MAG: nitrous oxide reductase accessory protein NosL [Halobacteriales archaeon]
MTDERPPPVGIDDVREARTARRDRASADGTPAVGRRVVLGAGAVALGGLAGCLGLGGEDTPRAQTVPDGTPCDVCGMVVTKHPGPNGQLFLSDATPDGHANPARFDSLKKCHFPYLFDQQDRGLSVAAEYVTDYSSVDYDLTTEGNTTYVNSHAEADAFAPAADLYYLVESDLQGAMGPDFYPFSEEADARSLADEHGGSVVEYDDITPALVGT